MDFGKLKDISQVNYALPDDPLQNQLIFDKLVSKTGKTNIYVGPTGYNMKTWIGKWYPSGTKDKEHLTHFGRQFNTIEDNTTHYRIPDGATIERWCAEVPDDFRYCPKLPQTISHARDLGVNSDGLQIFCEKIMGLKSKLGCCFLQLPPYFELKNLYILEAFLAKWPKNIPLAIEARHENFFESTVEAAHFFQTLIHNNISTVITDVSGRRDACHLRLTNQNVLIRFVGNNLHPTDYERIDDWANHLKIWVEKGLSTLYFFTHQPDNLLAPEIAEYAVQCFSKIDNVEIRGPKPILESKQGSLF